MCLIPTRRQKKMARLRECSPKRVQLCYAMKANPFLICDLERVADHFEVCSPGEFRICERSGISMDKVVLSGVYKNPEDVDYIMERFGGRITYTAESLTQWTLIADAAQRLKKQVRVLLRLSNGSQFGMDPDEIKAILHGSHPFARVEGLHYFTGTQKKAPKRIQKELTHLDDFLDELARDCGWHAEMLEYGPGLPVCYFEGEKDSAPEMEQALCEALEQMRYQGPVTLELGRYIAACSGSYATRIVDVKTNLGNDYCIVDGGIHQVNYYGRMLATKRPPVTVLPERNEGDLALPPSAGLCAPPTTSCSRVPIAGTAAGGMCWCLTGWEPTPAGRHRPFPEPRSAAGGALFRPRRSAPGAGGCAH